MTSFKRLYYTFRMFTIRSGSGRAKYLASKKVYRKIGENVVIQPRVIPLYSELISIGNNVTVAKNVLFVTHDVTHRILNKISDYRYKEMIGCIDIKDNVFIGSNTTILYNTQIGPNVIIAAGSVVVKDCEPNSVYAGVPAKKIGIFDDFMAKRKDMQSNNKITVTVNNQKLTDEEIDNAWEMFENERK